jgi:hypothetical protein
MYDEELMIKDLANLFETKLNDEIDKINTEKGAVAGDPLFIENIPSEKYIFETLDSRILNYTGFFIMYGLVDTPIREQNINNYLEDVTITFQVATFDKGEKERKNTMYKLLRYRRALKQVIMDNSETVFRGYAKPLMASLKPDAFPYSSKKIILKIGIDVKASVTAN